MVMIVKKAFGQDLLHLALICSLLGVGYHSSFHSGSNYIPDIGIGVSTLGSTWGYTQTHFHNSYDIYGGSNGVGNPHFSKAIDYQWDVFQELNSLSYYGPLNTDEDRNVFMYLLNGQTNATSPPPGDLPGNEENPPETSLHTTPVFNAVVQTLLDDDTVSLPDTDAGRENVLDSDSNWFEENTDPHPNDSQDNKENAETRKVSTDSPFSGIDSGLSDTELDELQKEAEDWPSDDLLKLDLLTGVEDSVNSYPEFFKFDDSVELDLFSPDKDLHVEPLLNSSTEPALSLEEILQLTSLSEAETTTSEYGSEILEPDFEKEQSDTITVEDELQVNTAELIEEITMFENMLQTSQLHSHPHRHPHHHRAFQSRMPFMRTVSMEQRWQDLANLLSLPSQDPSGLPPHAFAHPHPPHPHHPHAHPHHPHAHPHAHVHPAAHNFTTGGYVPEGASRGVLLHNATLAPPMGDINPASSPYANVTMGSAVATSMNLTSTSESVGDPTLHTPYKMEGSHEMMYYQNATNELNQSTEGLFSAILNDEDLQLMDMAMTDGMYTMRMLENSTAPPVVPVPSVPAPPATAPSEERLDASSDSAVSSMGSEATVPSVSDGEWIETTPGAETNTHQTQYQIDYSTNAKYRGYDYGGYSSRHSPRVSDPHRTPPVAQKKHQMYGKRYFQEQGTGGSNLMSNQSGLVPHGHPPLPMKFDYNAQSNVPTPSYPTPEGASTSNMEMKYSCSLEFTRQHSDSRGHLEMVQHNHTYPMNPEPSNSSMQRPRDKQRGRKCDRSAEELQLSRDEKRARSLNIPICTDDIINLPMDEFNERLSKYDLTETQLSLIRDIRRRGKNKVAAQNCRKRKLDQILILADEVHLLKERKDRLLQTRESTTSELQRVKDRFGQLYRHVFQSLRDSDGNPYSPYEYSLQQSADGNIILVPRSSNSSVDCDLTSDTRRKQKDNKD